MTIPQELISRSQFLLWGMSAGKPKQPHSPKTLSSGDWQSPANWGTYDEAMRHVRQGERRGLGFAFGGNGIVGVDLDNVFIDGQLIPEAQNIVDTLDSFTEYSMSGNGLHVYVYAPDTTLGITKASFPFTGYPVPYPKEDKRHVEFYESAGYFAMTGKPYGDIRPMPNRGEQLKAVFAKYGSTPEPTKPKAAIPQNRPNVPTGGDDEHYLQIGLEKDRMLNALWNGHRPSGDESADDQSFMNKLAYWLNANVALMRESFLNSPYFAGKDAPHKKKALTRKDYLDRTIRKAVAGITITAKEKNAAFISGFSPNQERFKHNHTITEAPPVQEENWEQPYPFDRVEIPSFPVECLPPALREYVLAVSESTQTPVDMAAVKALAVMAACVQGKFKIEPKQDWREPLNLYIATVANPAERKSAVDELLVGVVREYEARTNETNKVEINRSRVKRKTLERTVDNLITQCSNGKATETELFMAQDELTGYKEQKPLRLFADDTTPEALISTLAENGGCLSVISSEGGLFSIMAGLYTNGKVNLDPFLKAHSGDSIRVDRKGRASEDIPDPCLTIALSIQPQVLEEVIGNGSFRGRGLPARFLYSMPVSIIGNRRYETTPISDECKTRYKELCFDLMSITNESPAILKLTDESSALSKQFYYSLEPRLRDDLEDCLDWAGKYHGQVMRITGILHCVNQLVFAETTLIDIETMQAAIRIGEYFLEHALVAYRMMGANSAVKEALYILGQLEKRRPGRFKTGELLVWCKRFKKVEDVMPGLDALIEHKYLRVYQPEYTGFGRPPANEYIVNPLVYSMEDSKE